MSCKKIGKFSNERFGRFARAALPHGTADHLAHITGRTASAAHKWLAYGTKPDADAIAALIGFFGPGFVAACFDAPWAERLARDERRDRLREELAALG